MKKPCLILLGGAGWDVRRRAISVALTAAAFGHPVVVALSGEPLRAWLEGRFDDAAPPEAAGARVVWLCAQPSTLVDRVKSGMHRPLLDGDAAGTLQRMFTMREPLYREVADAIVLVDQRSIGEVVEAVLR